MKKYLKILINKKVINVALYILIAVFLVNYLRSIDTNKLRDLHFNLSYLAIASLISLLFRYQGVYIWRLILKKLGAVDLPGFRTLSFVYSKAWLGRYIPGTVTWIAGKVYFASSHGISKKRLSIASVLEGATQICAIFALSMFFLSIDSRFSVVSREYRLLMAALGISGIILLWQPIFNKIIVLLLTITKKIHLKSSELESNNGAVFSAILNYSFGFFISGASYFFLTKAFYPSLALHDFFFIVAIFNIAGVIGMLSILTPSGIGVRESVQLLLLPLVLPLETALLITVIARLWSVIIDLVFFLIATILAREKSF